MSGPGRCVKFKGTKSAARAEQFVALSKVVLEK